MSSILSRILESYVVYKIKLRQFADVYLAYLATVKPMYINRLKPIAGLNYWGQDRIKGIVDQYFCRLPQTSSALVNFS